MLDEFFSRYNKVVLDGMALDTEQAKLKRENSDLRSILKQYLDGISVTDEGMAQHNSLLVVNNRYAMPPHPYPVGFCALLLFCIVGPGVIICTRYSQDKCSAPCTGNGAAYSDTRSK